jgi:hypothetical protein
LVGVSLQEFADCDPSRPVTSTLAPTRAALLALISVCTKPYQSPTEPIEHPYANDGSAGQGLKMAARTMGVAVTTARSQLQQVFGKTGTNHQAELVALVHKPCRTFGTIDYR